MRALASVFFLQLFSGLILLACISRVPSVGWVCPSVRRPLVSVIASAPVSHTPSGSYVGPRLRSSTVRFRVAFLWCGSSLGLCRAFSLVSCRLVAPASLSGGTLVASATFGRSPLSVVEQFLRCCGGLPGSWSLSSAWSTGMCILAPLLIVRPSWVRLVCLCLDRLLAASCGLVSVGNSCRSYQWSLGCNGARFVAVVLSPFLALPVAVSVVCCSSSLGNLSSLCPGSLVFAPLVPT